MLGKRLQKAKNIALRHFKKIVHLSEFEGNYYKNNEDDKRRALGIFRKTKTRCSCWMCGHQRKYWGRRFTEKKKLIDEQYPMNNRERR